MAADALLLLVLAFLGACGARVAARACRVSDPSLAGALGLPLALSVVLLAAGLLARVMPLWGCLALAGALVGVAAWSASQESPEREAQDFTSGQRWLLAFVLLASVFYLHTSQLARPEDDFWIHYPVTRSLLKGNIPPVNPYFPDLPLQGHYGRHLLLATMSTAVGGDTLRTQWILELVLMVNSVCLWSLALRRAAASARAGALGATLVFLGVNVGSRVGLMDAYDNNNLLVYLLLAALLGLFAEILRNAERRWPVPWPLLAATALIAGAYGAVYETHFVLALGAFTVGAAAVGTVRRSSANMLARAVLVVVAGSTLLAVAQGGTLQNLALRALGQQPQVAAAAGEQNQSQHVTVRFPKDPFLAIRLGVDPYQRFSFALDTALFRRYQPALDDGGYASIFGPKVLVLHWLPTWLAPLTLAWAIRRRSLPGGLLGAFGLLAYLTPGLFDFGPVHEAEYFRWEFAAGVAFAGLLGLALADLWDRRPPGAKGTLVATGIVLLILVDLVGAQRRLNDLAIELQRDTALVNRTMTPWYPDTQRWMLGQKSLDLTQADLSAAAWLWANARPGDRVLTGFRTEGHESILWEAAMAGLAGVFPVGHALPPPWLPVGVAPYLPDEATVAYRQTRRPEVLGGLRVDWVLQDPAREKPPEGLRPFQEVVAATDRRNLYRLGSGAPGPLALGAPQGPEASVQGVPSAWEAGVAYPVAVKLAEPRKGWLAPVLSRPDGSLANRLGPVTVRVDGSEAQAWVVPPLEEGDYQLSWAFAPEAGPWEHLPGEVPAPYHFSVAVEESLRVQEVILRNDGAGTIVLRNVSNEEFAAGGPVRVQWWVWHPERHGYRVPFAPEGQEQVDLKLAPGAEHRVDFQLSEPVPPGGRVDVSVAARLGPPLPVARLHASFMTGR